MQDKKLFKSKNDRKIAGVCGGVAKYLNIDSTVVRVLWALSCCIVGGGLLAYIICAVVMPDEQDGIDV